MFKFLHTSDLHLDSPLVGLSRYPGAPAEQLRNATRQALENLVDLALNEQVAFVLMAGDLYDGDWRDYHTGLFLAHQMSRLREADIAVFILAGNHDAASQITKVLNLPENVTRFPTRHAATYPLENIGVAVHGQGFSTPAITVDLSNGYPKAFPDLFNIGMLHTAVTGRQFHASYAPCTLEGLLTKNYDYWALGHVHQREILHQDPWVVFPGNLQGRHIRETGSKGATLVTVLDGQVSAVEHVDLDVVRWSLSRVDVTGIESASQVLDLVMETLEKEISANTGCSMALRLHISGPCRAHEELVNQQEYWLNEIRNTVNDVSVGNAWLEKVIFQTSASITLEELLAAGGALASFLQGLEDFKLDEDGLADLVQEFADLHRKMPPELRSGLENLELDNPDFYKRSIDDVKQYILARLLSQSGSL